MNNYPQRAPAPVYRNILVPLDGSNFSSGALPAARALATRFDARLQTISVSVSDLEFDRLRREVAAALGTEADDPCIHVDADVDVAGAIQRCADELGSCLLCMSTHNRGRVGGVIIGSTAREVVERTHEPLVLIGPLVARPELGEYRPAPPVGVDHIVACVDGSPDAEQVLAVASAWAQALAMNLTVVTVAEPCPPPERIGAPWRRHHGPNADADDYVRDLAERWAGEAPGLDTFVVYDPISAAEGMKDYLYSHPTGLIVVGSHLRSGLERLAFGSTAAQIVHAASAPALIVPVA